MSRNNFKKLNVFIASPSDVAAEKACLISVVNQLNDGLADYLGIVLEVKEWSKVVPDMGRGQKVIFDQLPVDKWDIMIGILWLRYGMASGGENPEESGTHEEFNAAYECWQKTNKPRIMFYRCTRLPDNVKLINTDSLEKINKFFKEFETDGKNRGLYCEFDTTQSFERLVREHLEKILIEYTENEHGKPVSSEEIQVFSPRFHDSLPRRMPFFGRKNEITKALRALDPEDRGWGLVIDGIGGIGKTALAVEVAHICKEMGSFNSFVFITAKNERLEPIGIRKLNSEITTLDALLNEVARLIGQPRIAQVVSDKKGRVLIDTLRGTKSLIVFDNLETLTSAEQTVIGDFLRTLSSDCKAIVTSRHRTGESAVTIRLGQLHWKDAQQLIESEMSRHPDVNRVFSRIDKSKWKHMYDEIGGSPLVLTWVIGLIRTRRFTFNRILEVLHDSNVDDDLNTFIYHQAQSLMDNNEKTVLWTLSYFSGSASSIALSKVADIALHTLEVVLERLNTLSLIDVIEGADDQDRYTLHPLTKQFASSDLKKREKTRYALGMRFSEHWIHYSRQYGLLDIDRANLEAAVNWLWGEVSIRNNAIKDEKAAELLIELEFSIGHLLRLKGFWNESVLLTSCVYEIQRIRKKWQFVRYLTFWLSFMSLNKNDLKSAELWINRYKDAQSYDGEYIENPDALFLMGQIAQETKEYSEAERLFKEVRVLWKENNKIDKALVSASLGILAVEMNRQEEAQEYYSEAITFAHDIKLEEKETQPYFANVLGKLALELGFLKEANEWFTLAGRLAKEAGNIEAFAQSEYGLACLLYKSEKVDLALRSALFSLKVFESLHHKDLINAQELIARLKSEVKIIKS